MLVENKISMKIYHDWARWRLAGALGGCIDVDDFCSNSLGTVVGEERCPDSEQIHES